MRLGKKRPEEREKKNGKKMVNEEKRNIHDSRQCEEERGWRHLTIKMRLGEGKSYERKEL